MEVEHIKQTWHELAGRRNTFVEGFYDRLFERHPAYREKFPDDMSAQMEHMVEMVSSVARYCDHMGLIEPYLRTVGYAHRSTGIRDQDVRDQPPFRSTPGCTRPPTFAPAPPPLPRGCCPRRSGWPATPGPRRRRSSS